MAIGEDKGRAVSPEWALRSLSGCCCRVQIQRDIIPEFRSMSAKVNVPVSLTLWFVKKKLNIWDRSAPEPKINPEKRFADNKGDLKLDSKSYCRLNRRVF